MPEIEKTGEDSGEIKSETALPEEDQLIAEMMRYVTDPAVREALAKADRERFGDKMDDCRLREGETPEDFEKRLHLLYPEEAQKSYITALMRVSQATEYALYYRYGIEERLHLEELEKMYTKNPDKTLTMSPDYSNDLIRACNTARSYLEERSNNLVKKSRNELEDELLGKKKSGNLALDMVIKGLNTISKPPKEVIDQVKQEITAKSLWLLTPLASEALRYISLSCREPIDPEKLLYASVDIACASREMDIYIDYTDFGKVYRRDLRKEVLTSNT